MYHKMSVMNTRNSHGKLADSLIFLDRIKGDFDLLNIISRKELSELSSISLESVNKILLQLKHDKIIDITKNKISILQRDLLEKLSTVG